MSPRLFMTLGFLCAWSTFQVGFFVVAVMVRWLPSIRAVKGFSGLEGRDDRVLFGTWVKPVCLFSS